MHNQSIKRKDDKKKKKIITRCTVYSLSLSFSELSSLGLSSRACDALDDCGDGKDGGMRFRKSGCAVLIPFTIHITACFCEIGSSPHRKNSTRSSKIDKIRSSTTLIHDAFPRRLSTTLIHNAYPQ